MRMLRWMILGGAVILVVTPARAQSYDPRYPVCLQVWQWGGSYYFDCSYTTWDQCRANAVGLAAMCLDNPYWPRARPRPSGGRLRSSTPY
ncbi:DUF3551 domain-containing protein [Bradyrhizobium lablabi]|uniref:DUF3551 domain-containing protein n=1 Tax=Bradyrhizobium lablabi TaxID=722472 RepID=UPI001BA7BA39|nr:DUF3551 domain-containing protein [Bradyrhizobium lablabi]MBR0692260.1 DUF3551 domain-containing protein [Bradyrhizobium lablabi]